jgi:predicted secreted protein
VVSGGGAIVAAVSGVAGVAAGVLGDDGGGVVLGLIEPALVSVVVAGGAPLELSLFPLLQAAARTKAITAKGVSLMMSALLSWLSLIPIPSLWRKYRTFSLYFMDRRVFLATTGYSLAGLMLGGPDDDEPTEEVKRVLKARFGDRTLTKAHVQFDIPENAPDGRFVPIFLETDLPLTADHYIKAFHVIVDHNPDIYVAGFWGVASIDSKIKMRRTSYVRAIAEMNTGELYVSAKKVFVTLNGCG